MSASGFTHSEAEQLIGGVDSNRSIVRDQAESTVKTIANVTTEGLQGQAAEAAQMLANDVQTTLDNVDRILNDYQQKIAAYGEQFTADDQRSAGEIFSM